MQYDIILYCILVYGYKLYLAVSPFILIIIVCVLHIRIL
jgi:hypothetical protein